MKRWLVFTAVLIVGVQLFYSRCASESKKGYLLIVGGGKRPPAALQKFVQLCEGAPILVLTSASGVPHESGAAGVRQFMEHGAVDVSYLHIDDTASANADTTIAKIERCRGIFFTGGVQQTLIRRLGGTRAEATIRKIYDDGGVIGGTSAGAAVMSRVMITGNELAATDTVNAFSTIQAGNIETESGFGFLETAIIDQHFVKRKRNNRLISCVLEHPHLIGVGIDESTAILVHPHNRFEVYGAGTVLIYDARKSTGMAVDGNGLLRARDLRMHVLTGGDTFQLP